MKAWIYCRVNEIGCKKLGENRATLKELVDELGYEVAGFTSENMKYSRDEALSPGLEEVIQAARQGQMNMVIFKDEDYFTDNEQQLITLLDTCIRNNIVVESSQNLEQMLLMKEKEAFIMEM